ncbi:NAD(P)/FAD-dependent oxidoreductase [Phyllobacterium zundukense]|uniref:FAD/NAD(P)-binding oxidoreductase n=1 Tax=Phyllobacterium zundukense TaxID=1867719 RepID=A0A2N9VUP4_9HYPH|nr:NAD(P)/FAD-dependent oxidoreductase [Phyllobacterium zundukense]ATU95331.1 FAD/NAD(P)-binding oxidoreductase [Phyllobacterium zundukense]PIO43212.1 FAD/NAD(P)-binding oxidoreductase [Phyllobacterium zundukense]
MTVRLVSKAEDLLPVYDLIVVGAGPAGMAAAIEASKAGVRVAVLDENPRPGGQIYREITRNQPSKRKYLGADYWQGKPLAGSFAESNADYVPSAAVWSIEPAEEGDGNDHHRVGLTVAGAARIIEAAGIILATGAQERPMPVPGWTLPGVMTAGAAQIALKSSGVVPSAPIVLAGCGPLLYLLASQLIDAGARDMTLLDTSQSLLRWGALRHLPGFLLSPYLSKGLSLLLKTKRNIRVVTGVQSLAILGGEHAEGVRFATRHETDTLQAETVLLHQGIIPSINLASAAGCPLTWNEGQRAFQPATDAEGRTLKRGILIAGDSARIEGAQAAEICGRVAALATLSDLRLTERHAADTAIKQLQQRRQRYFRGRDFLDALYTPRHAFLAPPDPQTIVCRCEEITAGKLREAIALGPPGPNQLKTFVRCGMGPCQGRLCAATVTEIMADEKGMSPCEVGTYRLRSPVKPVRLAELAGLPHAPRALKAVTGRDPVDHQLKETGHSS